MAEAVSATGRQPRAESPNQGFPHASTAFLSPLMNLSEIWDDVRRVALEQGARQVGAAGLDDAHAELFAEWIRQNQHASMHYLEKSVAIRRDPRTRYPWAQSAIVMLVPYSSNRPEAHPESLSNHVARYALGDDYHEVLDRMLRRIEQLIGERCPDAKTWRYVDTGPLSDRALAANAGLGWIGRNGMLLHEGDGSYTFIATLLTSLANDMAAEPVADRCGTCTRCVDACPTLAILPSRLVDSGRCISYATIEHRGALEERVAERLEGNAFGCDICQEVCPWNGRAPESHPAFAPRDEYRATPLTDLLRFTQSDFSALFRRSAIKRAKLEGMKRNISAIVER